MWKALGCAVLSYLVGLFLDQDINFIHQNGYLMLRIILPMFVLGGFILANKDKKGH